MFSFLLHDADQAVRFNFYCSFYVADTVEVFLLQPFFPVLFHHVNEQDTLQFAAAHTSFFHIPIAYMQPAYYFPQFSCREFSHRRCEDRVPLQFPGAVRLHGLNRCRWNVHLHHECSYQVFFFNMYPVEPDVTGAIVCLYANMSAFANGGRMLTNLVASWADRDKNNFYWQNN